MKTKKFFSIATMILTMAFVSCSKDDKDETPDSLVNTTWLGEKIFGDIIDGKTIYNADGELNFKSGNKCTIQNKSNLKSYSGTYTYVKPNVSVTLSFEGNVGTLNGSVDGNKMTILSGGMSWTLIKK
jgi:hypothetical protein